MVLTTNRMTVTSLTPEISDNRFNRLNKLDVQPHPKQATTCFAVATIHWEMMFRLHIKSCTLGQMPNTNGDRKTIDAAVNVLEATAEEAKAHHHPAVVTRPTKPKYDPHFPQPWEKQPGENDRDFDLFEKFIDRPPTERNLREVAVIASLSHQRLSQIARQRDWTQRATAYDKHLDAIYRRELDDQIREMAGRHAATAAEALKALAVSFQPIIDRMNENPEEFVAELGAQPIKQLFSSAIRSAQVLPNLMNAERLARGQPTEITQHTEDVNIMVAPDPDRIAEVLDVLESAGVLDGRGGIGRPREIIDTEDYEIHADNTDD